MPENRIVVSDDGMWPFRWRWVAYVAVVETRPGGTRSGTERLSGEALTKDRARKKALRAVRTIEVFRDV